MDVIVNQEYIRLERRIQKTIKSFCRNYVPDESSNFNGLFNDDFNINTNATIGDISLALLILTGNNIGLFISSQDSHLKMKALMSIFMYQYTDIVMIYFHHSRLNPDKSFIFLKNISLCALLGVILGMEKEVYVLGKIIESFKHGNTQGVIISHNGDEISDIALCVIDVFLSQEISDKIKSETYTKTKKALTRTFLDDSYFEYAVKYHNSNSGQSNDERDFVMDNAFYITFPVLILSIIKINSGYITFFGKNSIMNKYLNLINSNYNNIDIDENQKLDTILSSYTAIVK